MKTREGFLARRHEKQEQRCMIGIYPSRQPSNPKPFYVFPYRANVRTRARARTAEIRVRGEDLLLKKSSLAQASLHFLTLVDKPLRNMSPARAIRQRVDFRNKFQTIFSI